MGSKYIFICNQNGLFPIGYFFHRSKSAIKITGNAGMGKLKGAGRTWHDSTRFIVS
jgi:hypothetical protein